MTKKNKKLSGWLIMVALIILAFVPDPSDVLDAGTPLAEIIGAVLSYLLVLKKK